MQELWLRSVRMTSQERFEAKFVKGKEDDCWNWLSTKLRTGYGRFLLDGRQQLAHRVAYQTYIGDIPDGICVCHRCDNPSCVNPFHLFLGTIADNVHDRNNKGRHVDNSGEKHGKAKLTEENIVEIRARYANGERGANLAREFGVTRTNIGDVVHYRTWTKLSRLVP